MSKLSGSEDKLYASVNWLETARPVYMLFFVAFGVYDVLILVNVSFKSVFLVT